MLDIKDHPSYSRDGNILGKKHLQILNIKLQRLFFEIAKRCNINDNHNLITRIYTGPTHTSAESSYVILLTL